MRAVLLDSLNTFVHAEHGDVDVACAGQGCNFCFFKSAPFDTMWMWRALVHHHLQSLSEQQLVGRSARMAARSLALQRSEDPTDFFEILVDVGWSGGSLGSLLWRATAARLCQRPLGLSADCVFLVPLLSLRLPRRGRRRLRVK